MQREVTLNTDFWLKKLFYSLYVRLDVCAYILLLVDEIIEVRCVCDQYSGDDVLWDWWMTQPGMSVTSNLPDRCIL